ncbi:hypothetical protein LCGC14_2978550, partial [marine sediment metagenome]
SCGDTCRRALTLFDDTRPSDDTTIRFISTRLKRIISVPFLELATTAQRITEEGDWSMMGGIESIGTTDQGPQSMGKTVFQSSIRAALLTGLLVAAANAPGQGTRADYERAKNLGDLTRNKVFKTKIDPHWFAENTQFWYRNDLSGGAREFVLVQTVQTVQTDQAMRRPAFDHARLAQSLSAATGEQFEATRLPIDAIEFDVAENAIRFHAAGKRFRCDLENYTLSEEASEEPTQDQPTPDDSRSHRKAHSSGRSEQSPDGKWIVFIKEHNLYLRDKQSGEEYPLCCDATEDDSYEPRVYWSADSKRLVALRTKKGDQRKVYMIESSPKDQLQPKLHSIDYPKPGDRLPISKPHLFDVEQRKEIPVSDEL